MRTEDVRMPNLLKIILLSMMMMIRVSQCLTYPVLVGGFSGSTYIQRFQMDQAKNLAIAAISSDRSLVSNDNQNLVMYFPQSASKWSWAKTLDPSIVNENVADMKIHDNQGSILILYESSLLVVIEASNGQILMVNSCEYLKCDLGCFTFFTSSEVELIGVFVPTTGTQYIGFKNLPVALSTPSSTVKAFRHGGTNYKFPVAIKLQSLSLTAVAITEETMMKLLIVENSLGQAQVLHQFSTIQGKARALAQYAISGSNVTSDNMNVIFGYVEHFSSQNIFYIARIVWGHQANTVTHDQYIQITESSSTQIQFLDFGVSSTSESFALAHFKNNHKVVLYQFQMDSSISLNSISSKELVTAKSTMTLTNGQMFNTWHFYIAGNEAQDIVSILEPGKIPFSADFVHSFQQIENDPTLDPQLTTVAVNSFVVKENQKSQVATNIAFSDESVTYNIQILQTAKLQVPAVSYSQVPWCLIQYQVVGHPLSQKIIYIDDPNPNIKLDYYNSPQACSGITCHRLVRSNIPPGSNDIIETWDASTTVFTFQTQSDHRHGETYMVRMITIAEGDLFNPCGYFYNYLEIKLAKPYLEMKNPPGLIATPIIYKIGDPQRNLDITQYEVKEGIVGDPKLNIIQQIQYQDGSNPFVPGSLFLNFHTVTFTLSIMSNDDTLPAIHNMKLQTWFDYLPSQKVEQNFQVRFEKCHKTEIFPSSVDPQIYQVGEPELVIKIPKWSSTYKQSCEPFTYTATSTPVITYIQFDAAALQFKVASDNTNLNYLHIMTLKGALVLPSDGSPNKEASVDIPIIIFHPSGSYITPEPIDTITYVLRDPELIVTIPEFSSNQQYLQPMYELMRQDGRPFNQMLMTFDPKLRQLKIKSDNTNFIGTHFLKIRAKFSRNTPYFVESLFKVRVEHWCSRDVLKAPKIIADDYIIASPEQSFVIPQWQQSMQKDCPGLTYQSRQIDFSQLPKFIQFSPERLRYRIWTRNVQDEKTYSIMVQVNAKYYNREISTTSAKFNLRVKCEPQKLFSLQQKQISRIKVNMYLQNPIPFEYTYKDFEIDPKCVNQTGGIKYQLQYPNNQPVENHIKLDQDLNAIQILDNDRLKPNSILNLVLVGQLKQLEAKLHLQIYIKNEKEDSSSIIYLPPVQLNITASQIKPQTFISNDFKTYTTQPYSHLLIDQSSSSFIQFQQGKQQLLFSPKDQDVGLHQVILRGQTDTIPIIKVIQVVSVLVESRPGMRRVEAVISKISRNGQVTIDFNQKMWLVANASKRIDEEVLHLYLTNKKGEYKETQPRFNWTLEQFDPDGNSKGVPQRGRFRGARIEIKLRFKDPLEISQNEYDYLTVKFMNRTYFRSSENNATISFKYQTQKKIPRQLASDSSSQSLGLIIEALQNFLQLIKDSSPIVQFIFAYFLSRIWGMIKSIQIILLFPLTLVDFPPNVELLHYFITFSCNSEMVTIDLLRMDSEKHQPFNDKFDDQGFSSQHFMENGRSSFNNVNYVFVAAIIFHILSKLLTNWSIRNIKVGKYIPSLYTYNLLVMMLMDYAFQHIIFAMVNVQYTPTGKQADWSLLLSYISSWIYLILYLGMTGFTIHLVKNHFSRNLQKSSAIEESTQSLEEEYPKIQSLFSDFRPQSKASQLYYPIFLVRRFILSAVIVFVQDHFFQIYLLTLSSLCSIYYMIRFRPFTSKEVNYVETFNEIMTLACCYHLLVFSQVHDSVQLKYDTGWSLVIMILIQLVVNSILEIKGMIKAIKELYPALVQMWQRIRCRRAKMYQMPEGKEGTITNMTAGVASEMEVKNINKDATNENHIVEENKRDFVDSIHNLKDFQESHAHDFDLKDYQKSQQRHQLQSSNPFIDGVNVPLQSFQNALLNKIDNVAPGHIPRLVPQSDQNQYSSIWKMNSNEQNLNANKKNLFQSNLRSLKYDAQLHTKNYPSSTPFRQPSSIHPSTQNVPTPNYQDSLTSMYSHHQMPFRAGKKEIIQRQGKRNEDIQEERERMRSGQRGQDSIWK